jgi:hypothetical protein
MIEARQFWYPRNERMKRLGLFLLALLLPVLVVILGFIALVAFPPYHPLNDDLFLRLIWFWPHFISNNPGSVLILCGSLWLLTVAVTLPNAITHSLIISADDERIVVMLFGFRWRCFSWYDVRQIEQYIIKEYDGVAWNAVSAIKFVSSKGRLSVRQTISGFQEFLQIVVLQSKKYGFPIVKK